MASRRSRTVSFSSAADSPTREMQAQVLDSMELERERGITIKAQSVTLYYTRRTASATSLNLIDTPATWTSPTRCRARWPPATARCWWWMPPRASKPRASPTATPPSSRARGRAGHHKIDLPPPTRTRVSKEIEEIIGIEATDASRVECQDGRGRTGAARNAGGAHPGAEGRSRRPLQALIVDSWFDNYVGVVSLVRIINGS